MSAKAAIYTRISVDRPEETSLEGQEARCRQYADQHGWEVVGTYTDRGRSAYTGGARPQLKKLLADVELGMVDVVVVWKLDRWCRSLQEFVELRRTLERAGCRWASVTDSFDTSTAMGEAMLGVVAVFAELESAIKSERINDWHARRQAAGVPPAGPVPFGYRRVGTDWELDPDRSELVRQAAQGLLAGETSVSAIVRDWQAKGITTTRGGAWSRRALTKLLRSPTLAGMRVESPERDSHGARVPGTGTLIEGTWPAILDRPTHEALVELLADPRRRTNVGAAAHLLSGVAVCGRCGSRMGYRTHRQKRPDGSVDVTGRYSCESKRDGDDACRSVSIDADTTDEHVRQALAAAVADGLPTLETFDPGEVERLEKELSEVARDYGRGDITRPEWVAIREGIEARLADATAKAARSADAVPANLGEVWPRLTVQERRGVVLSLLEQVEVADGGRGADRLRLVWRA